MLDHPGDFAAGVVLVGILQAISQDGEDAARYYPGSLWEAELNVPVQKDVWHLMHKAAQTVTDLDRLALHKLE